MASGTGWPGRVRVELSKQTAEVALHASVVSTHSRREYEYRFQNPGGDGRPPVSAPNGSLPVLVGLSSLEGTPILVCADGRSRLGNANRFSILFSRVVISEAAVTGWAAYTNTRSERIYAIRPALFPALVEMLLNKLEVPATEMMTVVRASGLLEKDDREAAERARRATTQLVRDHAFGDKLRRAYGAACAMCGITLDLVVGAHIYPVSASKSPDEVWNGLALCPNHHGVFDGHLIWIDPKKLTIVLHPRILEEAKVNPAAKAFVDLTFKKIGEPENAAAAPSAEMLKKRYAYFENEYRWAD